MEKIGLDDNATRLRRFGKDSAIRVEMLGKGKTSDSATIVGRFRKIGLYDSSTRVGRFGKDRQCHKGRELWKI